MTHRTRLGPIAIFLAIVVMVITTLAILTVATSNADRIMSERFANVTRTRYELEAQGEKFLSEAAEAGAESGAVSIEGTKQTAEGFAYEAELDGYRLEVEITAPDAEGTFEVKKWKISKMWNESNPMSDLWPGL